jgi:hypothetical protein
MPALLMPNTFVGWSRPACQFRACFPSAGTYAKSRFHQSSFPNCFCFTQAGNLAVFSRQPQQIFAVLTAAAASPPPAWANTPHKSPSTIPLVPISCQPVSQGFGFLKLCGQAQRGEGVKWYNPEVRQPHPALMGPGREVLRGGRQSGRPAGWTSNLRSPPPLLMEEHLNDWLFDPTVENTPVTGTVIP